MSKKLRFLLQQLRDFIEAVRSDHVTVTLDARAKEIPSTFYENLEAAWAALEGDDLAAFPKTLAEMEAEALGWRARSEIAEEKLRRIEALKPLPSSIAEILTSTEVE